MRRTFRAAACVLIAAAGLVVAADDGIPIVLEEPLGYGWDSDLVHRPVTAGSDLKLKPDHLALELDGKPVAFQLDRVVTNADGTLRGADVWFRSDLPSHSTRRLVLRPGKPVAGSSVLSRTQTGSILEVKNALTALRLPAGTWTTPAEAVAPQAAANALVKHLGLAVGGADVPGPLLGVKLASGQWLEPMRVRATNTILGYVTEILEEGPIFIRARTTYRLANEGRYVVEVTLREGEPVVRVDERYERAGMLILDLGANLKPTKFATKADYRGNMQLTPIDYARTNRLVSFVGWDFYLADRSATIGYLGGPNDDLLGWMSTDAEWFPEPYKQMMEVRAEPGQRLVAEGSLESGYRRWAFLVAKGAQFPAAGEDLYRWWNQRIAFPLDKIVNWQLTWPDMEKIEFPHTFFSAKDLPDIRARLQAEPAIKAYMEALRASEGGNLGWSHRISAAAGNTNADFKARFEQYRAKYKERGGIPHGMAYTSAGYLYFGDPVYLEQMDDRLGVGDQTPREYMDAFIAAYLGGLGIFGGGNTGGTTMMGNMNVSDAMLLRCVALDLVLGSEAVTPVDKRELLKKLAFLVYVMHDPWWQPAVHMPDGSRPEGYGQGTPNQKHCAFSVRAMTACALANHPMKRAWMEFAMAELRPHYEYTIHESGALLESPFYSSRDSMRYAPFWSAMVRAGVKDVAPDYEQWMNRPKKAFQYLADMLTPKEPRMGGKRVYHPIGRSNAGVIDPSFMIGGDPWGLTDPAHGSLMRWCWQEQGKPSPDCMGSTGGRNIALTLLAFSLPFEPLKDVPLRSRRYEGMGVIFRSHPDSDYESNLVFRHDGFCWDLYAVNNGAVYFYGKGAPLLPRFGGYWNHGNGGAWMMDMPFGNRVDFASGNNNCFGSMTEFAALGFLADQAAGVTDDQHWRRGVLMAKDLDRDDPVYLLVRDDVNRPEVASALHWWIMTKNVQPDGLTKPGVVPIDISHENWVRNMGHNWEQAARKMLPPPASPEEAAMEDEDSMAARMPPKLKGQFHSFPGICGVDLDLFIAVPADPQITVDAASCGRMPYCVNKDLYETQELLRIAQSPGKGYLTLLMPRWPGATAPVCRTIAGGAGVAVKQPQGEDRLFLSDVPVTFADAVVKFQGRAGFVRHGPGATVRLMVQDGEIRGAGMVLACKGSAALVCDGKTVKAYASADPKDVSITLPASMNKLPIAINP